VSQLDGRVVVVTGAATGIGRASAVAFATAGASAVVIGDVDLEAAGETAELVAAAGAQSHVQRVDVADRDQVATLLAVAADRFGGVDVLHNNAGLVSGDPPWPGTAVERIEEVVRVNVLGVMFGTRLGIDAIAARGGGCIVNTASVAGLAPMPTDAVYAATKAAIISFTQSCAGIAQTHGVRVNAVLPGIVDTPILAKTGDGANPAAWLAPILAGGIPLKPEHVAAAVLGLVADDSKAGEALVVLDPPG
jgi:3-oxoacyl-[acyl-carrier protein] reductase